ncbi:hypothetical protein PanWU01x14_035380 [Parasponia andersonii]|uniref:Uncharacterized protein n=1 Tax=Parasponia andersonii TaxID=3476 RepID=A0A2P5DT69_PARAD|nr:hypothetical protein PanWU01x14_035380 [Parasponia andersonii]
MSLDSGIGGTAFIISGVRGGDEEEDGAASWAAFRGRLARCITWLLSSSSSSSSSSSTSSSAMATEWFWRPVFRSFVGISGMLVARWSTGLGEKLGRGGGGGGRLSIGGGGGGGGSEVVSSAC